MPPLQNASIQWGAADVSWNGLEEYTIEVPLHARGELATAFQHTLPPELEEEFGHHLYSDVRPRDATTFSVVISGLKGTHDEVQKLAHAVQLALTEACARTLEANEEITGFLREIRQLPSARPADLED